jgi:hypothetical protein
MAVHPYGSGGGGGDHSAWSLLRYAALLLCR